MLVSIQGMIFVDNPYCNEPGFANSKDSAASKLYKRETRLKTLKYALLQALVKTPTAFKDLLK